MVSRQIVLSSCLIEMLVRVSWLWLHLHLIGVPVLSILLHSSRCPSHVTSVAVDARVPGSAKVLLSVVMWWGALSCVYWMHLRLTILLVWSCSRILLFGPVLFTVLPWRIHECFTVTGNYFISMVVLRVILLVLPFVLFYRGLTSVPNSRSRGRDTLTCGGCFTILA